MDSNSTVLMSEHIPAAGIVVEDVEWSNRIYAIPRVNSYRV